MKKEDIDRINELARKAKTVGLTPEENEERAVLRRAYIDSVVGDLRQQGAQFGTRQAGVVDDHDAQWRLVHCGISSVARTM